MIVLFLAAALAADPPLSGERRLTAEQVQQVLDEAAARREAADATEEARHPLPITGEVGVSVGTGGYRSAYGAASIGLGGGSWANVSVGGERGRYRSVFDPAYGAYGYAPPGVYAPEP